MIIILYRFFEFKWSISINQSKNFSLETTQNRLSIAFCKMLPFRVGVPVGRQTESPFIYNDSMSSDNEDFYMFAIFSQFSRLFGIYSANRYFLGFKHELLKHLFHRHNYTLFL